jgi:hypothetical protein
VLLAMTLVGVLGASLTLTVASESLIAANYRDAGAALYAADAALERVLPDLAIAADWNQVLSGAVRSTFTDGAPSGSRLLSTGALLDLSQIVNAANCLKPTPCSQSDMNARTADRPWGPNNPQWRLLAYGPLGNLLPGGIRSPFYVIVLVGDDPSEVDNDPLRDGVAGASPGAGMLSLRAEAFGPHEAHRVIEMTVSRADVTAGGLAGGMSGLRVLSWRQMR